MEIVWLGHATFRIKTRVAGTQVTIVTDPYDASLVGFKFPKVTADIVTISHEHKDHAAEENVKGENDASPKILRGPGEYEVKGVTLRGVATWHDSKNGAERGENTVFTYETEKIRMAHFGDLGQVLTDAQLEAIGNIDIALLPVGGVYTITPQQASEVIAQLEPKIVIPMHYKIPGMGVGFDKLSGVDDFIKVMGVEMKRADKLDIKRENFGEEMQVVVLERKG